MPAQSAVLLDPVLDTATGALQLFTGRALRYPNFPLLVQGPVRLESQEDYPALIARMKPAESHDMCLLRGHRQFEQ